MAWITNGPYGFTAGNINRIPNQQGVYAIMRAGNKIIYIGRGNIRDRLMSHFNKQETVDTCIWLHSPSGFHYELAPQSVQREKELLSLYPTDCNA